MALTICNKKMLKRWQELPRRYLALSSLKVGEIVNAGGPPDLGKLKQVMTKHGLVPVSKMNYRRPCAAHFALFILFAKYYTSLNNGLKY